MKKHACLAAVAILVMSLLALPAQGSNHPTGQAVAALYLPATIPVGPVTFCSNADDPTTCHQVGGTDQSIGSMSVTVDYALNSGSQLPKLIELAGKPLPPSAGSCAGQTGVALLVQNARTSGGSFSINGTYGQSFDGRGGEVVKPALCYPI